MREAQFERDTSMFMAMSPKYQINWKEERITGQPADGGGKNPKWYADHTLKIGYDPANAGVINFTFLDDDSLIARAEVEISKMTD